MKKTESKLMMLLLIGSEAIFFLSLMMAYVYFWRSGNFAAASKNLLHIKTTALFTLLLMSSSFTFWKTEQQHNKGNRKSVQKWLLATIALGSVFLLGQGHEYYGLLMQNLTLSRSEFGTSFYTLTGFHGLHVLLGLISLFILFVLVHKGKVKQTHSSAIGTIGLYWHFVDVVWMAVFTLIYVIPYFV